MKASRSHTPSFSTPGLSLNGSTLGDFERPLRDMLADDDWRPACQHPDELSALLRLLQDHPQSAHQSPPPGLATLATAYADFCHFRRKLAAELNTPDDQPLHITPDEWLQYRLRHYGTVDDNLRGFGDYRMHRGRFHVS